MRLRDLGKIWVSGFYLLSSTRSGLVAVMFLVANWFAAGNVRLPFKPRCTVICGNKYGTKEYWDGMCTFPPRMLPYASHP